MAHARTFFLSCSIAVFVLVSSGCASTQSLTDVITVEGSVNRRGNEPFSAFMLETRDHNLYVLDLTEGMTTSFSLTQRYRITGRVYLSDWNSRPFTHLHVMQVEQIGN